MYLSKTVRILVTGLTGFNGRHVHELEVVTKSCDEMKARLPSILIIAKVVLTTQTHRLEFIGLH